MKKLYFTLLLLSIIAGYIDGGDMTFTVLVLIFGTAEMLDKLVKTKKKLPSC